MGTWKKIQRSRSRTAASKECITDRVETCKIKIHKPWVSWITNPWPHSGGKWHYLQIGKNQGTKDKTDTNKSSALLNDTGINARLTFLTHILTHGIWEDKMIKHVRVYFKGGKYISWNVTSIYTFYSLTSYFNECLFSNQAPNPNIPYNNLTCLPNHLFYTIINFSKAHPIFSK